MTSETRAGDAASAPARERPAALKGTFVEYAESLLVTLLLALFGTTFIVQAFKIPSQSMEPTLLVGDHLLVNKFIFEGHGAWYEKILPYRPIRRGEIIVFKYPFDDHPHYVKRVIGLPGDHLRIVKGQVSINGDPLEEPYVVHDRSSLNSFSENFPPNDPYSIAFILRSEWSEHISDYVQQGELVVPAKHYFAMGDNRDNSADSRFWGFVDRDAIMGRPLVIYWSVDATSNDYADRGLAGAIRGIVTTLLHLPTRIRWRRMLHGVH